MSYYASNYYTANFYATNYYVGAGGAAPITLRIGPYSGLYFGMYANLYERR